MILRLRAQGWSLRRIAADPRVGMTFQGVGQALDRLERDGREADEHVGPDWLPLLLYRRGCVERDAAWLNLWERYTARGREHEGALAQRRHGRPFGELPLATAEGIRRQALELAAMEVHQLILNPGSELPPIPTAMG